MYVDLVNCTNCDSKEVKVIKGGEICPRCSAVGCLVWSRDEQEIESDNYEEIKFHDYEPTDSQGHSMECCRCGHFTTVFSDEDSNREYIVDVEELTKDLFEIYGSFSSQFYRLKGSPVIYVETCNN